MSDWTGRRAVITGAASGIGRAYARALAAEGVDLVLCDRVEDELSRVAMELRARGVDVMHRVVDVTDKEAVAAFATEAAEAGPIHLLFNNAGVGVGGAIADTPPDAWDRVVGVNLLGVAYTAHAFLPHLQASSGLRAIVNTASASAFGGVPGLGAYAATKAAVLSLSETLQTELAVDGIQSHCVCPGFVRTGLLSTSELFIEGGAVAREKAWAKLFRPERTPDTVAERTLAAIRRDRFLVTVYPEGHGAALLRRFPGFVGRFVRARTLERMQSFQQE